MKYFNPMTSTKVSLVGVDSLWGDYTKISADWGLLRSDKTVSRLAHHRFSQKENK
jgi:hypothetical protein